MADLVLTNESKTAVRELTTPIADLATFDGLVQDIITNNPFGCTAYEFAGVSQPPVQRGRQSYVAKVVYEDRFRAQSVGNSSARAQTTTGFNAAVAALLGNATLATAIGGTPKRMRPRRARTSSRYRDATTRSSTACSRGVGRGRNNSITFLELIVIIEKFHSGLT